MESKPSVDPEVVKKSVEMDRYKERLKALCAGNLVQTLHNRVRVLVMLDEDDRIDDILAEVCQKAQNSGLFECTQEALKEQVLRGFGGYATASTYATGAKHASVSRPTLVPSPGSNTLATGGGSIEPAKEQIETVTDPLRAADGPETQGADDKPPVKLGDSIGADDSTSSPLSRRPGTLDTVNTPWSPDGVLPLTPSTMTKIDKELDEESQVTALMNSLRHPVPKPTNALGRILGPFEGRGLTQPNILASRYRKPPVVFSDVPEGKRRSKKMNAELSSTNLGHRPPEGTSKKTETEWQQDRMKTAVLKGKLGEHTRSENEYQIAALRCPSVDDDVSMSDLLPRRLFAENPEAHTKHSGEPTPLTTDKPTSARLEEAKDAHAPAHTSPLSPVTNMKLPSSSRLNIKRPPALSIPVSSSSSHVHGVGSLHMMSPMHRSIPRIQSPLRNSFAPDSDSSEDSPPLQLDISAPSKRLVASRKTSNATDSDIANPRDASSDHPSDDETALSQDELDESSELVTQDEIDEVVTRSVRNSLEAQRKRASSHLENGYS